MAQMQEGFGWGGHRWRHQPGDLGAVACEGDRAQLVASHCKPC